MSESMHAPIHRSIDLTGVWRFQPDPVGEGESLGYSRAEHDVRLWREAAVPCAYDDAMPGLRAYEGAVWWRRVVTLDASLIADSVSPVLRFEGVNYDADVWLNGRHLGRHEGGFLPFEFALHGQLCAGDNVLVVRSDNTRRYGQVPGKQRGWRPYGGILREVAIDLRPVSRLAQSVVHARADGSFDATVTCVNDTPIPHSASIALTILDASGMVVATCPTCRIEIHANAHASASFTGHVAGVRPWSPDDPVLYTARFMLWHERGSDALDVSLGFRTVGVRAGKLLLNGQPIRLLGFNRHEDTPQRGMCPDPAGVERDLRHMKSLGCNFVRLCHYPHHPLELDLCDRIGLLVMGEIPVYWWNGTLDSPVPPDDTAPARKLEAAGRQLTEMISRDINHPSIVIWSVSNETNEARPEVAAGNDELIALAKRLDPARLVTHVSDRWHSHPHFAHDDVICINGYPAWNGRSGERGIKYEWNEATQWWSDNLDKLHATHPDRPIVIAEFGYLSLPGVFGGAVGEDTHATAMEAEARAFDKPYIAGVTIWCYADHPWPEEPFLKNVTTSPYGVVTRDRRPKRALEAANELFARLAILPLPSGETAGVRGEAVIGNTTRNERDHDVSNMAVNMLRPHLRELPTAQFPEGFGIRPMQRDEGPLWEDVQRDAEPFLAIEPGLFDSQFGDDPDAIPRRCFLLTGPDGCAVGTISAWHSRDFRGGDWGRIHWVAVRRAFQRRGLARAGLAHAMHVLASSHERAWLATHSARVSAIKLYLDFGFVPDLQPPDAREAWMALSFVLDHPALKRLT